MGRERVALEKDVRLLYAFRRGHSRRERDRAIDVELLLAARPFELGVLHEVRRGLPELCRHVLEGFHRRADLPQLYRTHVVARVIGAAEPRLAQPRRDARLTESQAELAQRGRLGGGATLAGSRRHGARRYARLRAAPTVNRHRGRDLERSGSEAGDTRGCPGLRKVW